MDFALLGWPADGPTLYLDHERFAYAGKFVMSNTGKAVVRDEGSVVGATAFDADRTAGDTLRIRYVTVRADRQGEGIGPRLLQYTCECARERGFETAVIAVNNPVAYEAAYRAGFAYTGETTGLAELELEWRADATEAGPNRASGSDSERDAHDAHDAYDAGLAVYADRDLSEAERRLVERCRKRGPPEPCEPPPTTE